MIPHIAYINPMSSYYYFRPYQAFHVREHQNEVISYGGDPRNPYDNTIFRTLYAELETAWAEEESHQRSPFEDEIPEEGAPAIQPDNSAHPAVPGHSTFKSPVDRLRAVRKPVPMVRVAEPTRASAQAAQSPQRVFRTRQ